MLPYTTACWQSECKLHSKVHFSMLQMITRYLVRIIVLHSQNVAQKYSSLQSYIGIMFISLKNINIKVILHPFFYKYANIYVSNNNKLYTKWKLYFKHFISIKYIFIIYFTLFVIILYYLLKFEKHIMSKLI